MTLLGGVGAVDLGLVTYQGGFDVDAAREVFAIPHDYIPIEAMALGYQGK